MNIFDKRPLLLIITSLISGFVIFTFSGKILRGLLTALAILLICLSLFLFLKKKIKNKLIIIIPTALLVSMLLSLIYFDLYFDLYRQYDEAVNIEGTIVSREDYDYSSTVILKTSKINNKNKPGYKILLDVSRQQIDERYNAGAIISFNAKLEEFENFSDIDANAYYFAKGINANATSIGRIKLIGHTAVPLSSRLKEIREHVVNRMTNLSSENSAYLFSALFLGERDLLNDRIKLDFKVLGITHILALSGLHLSIISSGVLSLLSFLKIKKKPRFIIVSIIIVSYMVITGMSVSVVRAGIMIILSSALFLLGKTKDSLTSLAISVFLILLCSPYAIYDLALWLSALSTLGIVVMQELMVYKKTTTIIDKAVKIVLDSLLSSFFAISATLLITTNIFGTISIVSCISTLVFSLLAEAIIYIGMLVLIFGDIIPLGFILDFVSDITYKLARILSEPDWIYVSADSIFIQILVASYTIAFILFIISNFRNRRKSAGILVICFIVILISSTTVGIFTNNVDKAIYHHNDSGDAILLQSNSQTAMVASSDSTSSSAYDNFDFLTEHYITHLDYYYLTNYSYKLISHIRKLLSLIRMDIIYLPMPLNEDEENMLEDIKYELENYNVKLYIYQNEETVGLSKYTIKSLYRTKLGDKIKRNALTLSNGENTCLYLSSGMLDDDGYDVLLSQIKKINVIIFGTYGTRYSNPKSFSIYNEKISKIVICSKNLYINDFITTRYNKNGTKILDFSTVVNIFN